MRNRLRELPRGGEDLIFLLEERKHGGNGYPGVDFL